jgi:hypothetical protein
MMTYAGYSMDGYNESLLLVAVEYVLVVIFALAEWRTQSKLAQA